MPVSVSVGDVSGSGFLFQISEFIEPIQKSSLTLPGRYASLGNRLENFVLVRGPFIMGATVSRHFA